MQTERIKQHIDHTLLTAAASWKEIKIVCDEAVKNRTASVCVPPSYVKRISDAYGDQLNICTVIGFPLGYHTTEVKAYELNQAISDGANVKIKAAGGVRTREDLERFLEAGCDRIGTSSALKLCEN